MKKYIILIGIILFTTFSLAEIEYESIFPNITLDGKAAAMGSVNLINSPDKYTKNKGFNLEIGKKDQLGVIPYSYYKIGMKNFEIKLITSEDILKTTKLGIGTSYRVWKLNVGVDLNIFDAEIVSQKSGSYEIMTKAEEMGVTDEDLTGTKAKGVGTDISIGLDISPYLSLGYYLKNINTNLEWDVDGEKTEENLEQIEIFGVLYNKEDITVSGEIENFKRMNLGFERNYYERLDLRMGVSRNFDSKANKESQKLYSIGIGFVPGKINISDRTLKIGLDVGYQMKYFGDDDIFNGKSEDDIAFSTRISF